MGLPELVLALLESRRGADLLIVIFGYVWFFAVAAWAHDAETEAKRWSIVGGLAAVSLSLAIIFGSLGWL